MRNISKIYPAITENTKCLISRACTPFIVFKVVVSLDNCVPLRFVVFLVLQTLWATFQANARSAPANTILILVSHRRHNEGTANCHLHGSGERNIGEQR